MTGEAKDSSYPTCEETGNLKKFNETEIFYNNFEYLWARKKSFFNNKPRIRKVLYYIQKRKENANNKNKKKYARLTSILQGTIKRNWNLPSQKKEKLVKDFYLQINAEETRFSIPFIIANHKFINKKSYDRVLFLDKRHKSKENVNEIVKNLSTILACEIDKKKYIYSFLDKRHGSKEIANEIIEQLPTILDYSPERIKYIYSFLDKRHGSKEIANSFFEGECDPEKENLWERKKSFFNNKPRVRKVLSYIHKRKENANNKNKKKYARLTTILQKTTKPNWNLPSQKKEKLVKKFYLQINAEETRFSIPFIIANHKFINKKSYDRVLFLDKRHKSKENVNEIVKNLSTILACEIDRTKNIYSFLDERHGSKENVNKIIESFPAILGCKINRTKNIYSFFDKRHGSKENVNKIAMLLPTILGYSLERTKDIYSFLDARHKSKKIVNRLAERFPSILSHSLNTTKDIYSFLDARYGSEEITNEIIEKKPGIIGFAPDKTKNIFSFFDTKYNSTKTSNNIIKTLPGILTSSLEKTKDIYRAMKEKVDNADGFISNFPFILYISPMQIKTFSLEKIIRIANNIEEQNNKNEIYMDNEKISILANKILCKNYGVKGILPLVNIEEDTYNEIKFKKINFQSILIKMQEIYKSKKETFAQEHPGKNILYSIKSYTSSELEINEVIYKDEKKFLRTKSYIEDNGQICLSEKIPDPNETKLPLLVKL